MAVTVLALSAGDTLLVALIAAVIFIIVVVVCAVLLALLHVVLPQPVDRAVASSGTEVVADADEEAGRVPTAVEDHPGSTVA